MRGLCKSLFLPVLTVLAACVAPGPVDNPVGRALTWFSYVGGQDIQESCRPGTPERYRFVYNGIYGEQVRTYDVAADALERQRAVLQSRAYGGASFASIDLRAPFETWNGAFDQRLLTAEQWDRLRREVAASGFFGPTPSGKFLRSDAFYWAVSACRDGRFHFNAWEQPGFDLSRLGFVPVLLELDRTPLAFNPPRRLQLGPFEGGNDPDSPEARFRLQVGDEGLRLGPRWR